MTLEQAIQVFDQVRKKFVASGEDHETLLCAMETIVKEVQKVKEE